MLMPASTPAPRTLADLRVGEEGIVAELEGERVLLRRLSEMGLLPGTPVRLVRAAPLGDPIELRLRNTSLSIRKAEARRVRLIAEGEAGAEAPGAEEAPAWRRPERGDAAPFELPDPKERPLRVALAGNPNAGKTTLFNALTGGTARTGNYPGVTVERSTGKWRLPGEGAIEEVELLDVPGTYSLSARSPEEQVAIESLLPFEGEAPDAVLIVVDATVLVRNLYLVLEILEAGVPAVVALNMMDEAKAAGIAIDVEALEAGLGCPVMPIVARDGQGLGELAAAVEKELLAGPRGAPPPLGEGPAQEAVAAVEARCRALFADRSAAICRARARWALLSLGGDELEGVPPGLREAAEAARAEAQAEGLDLDRALIRARYAQIEALTEASLTLGEPGRARALSDRLDSVLTHPIAGFFIFLAVMLLLFQALFSWSEPLVGGIEAGVGWVQGLITGWLPAGPLTSLLSDGVVAGVGNVIVFVPQIGILFVFITILEDSGYLARVAFVIDRLMRGVGLHGKAFVPLLSGYACAVPAIMATRTIESRRDRLVTMLALPLMSCSARLPVYTLVIATVFAANQPALGFLSVGALVMLAMYGLSLVATLGAAAVLRRTLLRGPTPALVLELPPYRMPGARNVLRATWTRVRSFLVDAGTIILAITIVLWGLLSFPKSDAVAARAEAARTEARAELDGEAQAEALEARLAEIEAEEAEAQMSQSYAGRLGRFIEPAIAPLGFDWKIGVGLIGSFAAREVLVSTLGIVYGVGASADEESVPLREALRRAERPDGAKVFTPLAGISLMVFFVLAAQCMSTLAVLKRESGSFRWPLFMLAYMSALAYLGSLITYQGGLLLGFG